jgi:YVTN family beta-propeller protein
VSVAFSSGSTFAGYRIESVIGRGGMGVVYRATDLSLERPVALKLVAPELAQDELFRRRFLKEPRLAASLDHPNVVPIYEAGEHDRQLYLAMRFVEGSDMRTLLRGPAGLGLERALAILGQVAGALDAAHRRGLVHRDVKPANVLVDSDGHAYLTDFGVTKQLGGDTTETGQIVGTLDYLAPEQIRGEPIDGRADVYALACVLYECLAGAPPFHRATEAETLWAHMQEPVPPLPDQPALDTVMAKALAKQPDERYTTCAELIEAARDALASPIVPPRLLRWRHAILAAGVLALAATAAAAVLLVGGEPSSPEGNGLAAIAAGGDEIASFTSAATPPSNVAVGEGAVWMLNTEDETVSRVDPETGEVVGTVDPPGVPTDIAAGAGALWIGTSPGGDVNYTTEIARVDPDTGKVTRTVELPDSSDGEDRGPVPGFPRIAVGDGAIWAINPDESISRIDPETGRLVAKVPTPETGARTLAAGDAGVWVLGWENAMVRIEPRANRAQPPIELGSNFLPGIAVGGGAVWASSEEGQLWRVEPGPRPLTRTIEVGAGVQYVAYGDGVVWAANWNDGTVARVDPATNAVTARIPVGATQALAAGTGSAWVSVAGATRDGTLPATACGEIKSGGRTPDVIVASDMPLRGAFAAQAGANARAVGFVIEDHGFRAGDHVVGYQSCDDSTAQAGIYDPRRCAANAQAFAGAERLVAVVGPHNSQCAQIEVPIANRASGGPLAIVSPSSTSPNLTRGGELALPPPFGFRGEPDVYYPTGERNLLRLAARSDLQGVALAQLARDLGLSSVYLVNDGPGGVGDVLFTDGFERAAPELGVGVAGVAGTGDGEDYADLADRVARTGADGVLLGTFLDVELLKALRKRLGRRVVLMAGDGFMPVRRIQELAGDAAEGLYVATPELSPGAVELTADGERFVRGLGEDAHASFALQSAQATEAVLAAIARSDGTRSSVLRELRAIEESDGLFGHFRFDRYGDITPARLTILRVTADVPPEQRLPGMEGAVVERVIDVPTD